MKCWFFCIAGKFLGSSKILRIPNRCVTASSCTISPSYSTPPLTIVCCLAKAHIYESYCRTQAKHYHLFSTYIYTVKISCSHPIFYVLLQYLILKRKLPKMAEFIVACQDLVDFDIEYGYPDIDDAEIEIPVLPKKIVENTGDYYMSLYASAAGGPKAINIRSPRLKRELRRLADQGQGGTIIVDDIKYMFIRRESFGFPLHLALVLPIPVIIRSSTHSPCWISTFLFNPCCS